MCDLDLVSNLSNNNLRNNPNALDTLRPRLGTALLVSKLNIYIWHGLSASDMLAVAISRIACEWCGSGLNHVARVCGHVC